MSSNKGKIRAFVSSSEEDTDTDSIKKRQGKKCSKLTTKEHHKQSVQSSSEEDNDENVTENSARLKRKQQLMLQMLDPLPRLRVQSKMQQSTTSSEDSSSYSSSSDEESDSDDSENSDDSDRELTKKDLQFQTAKAFLKDGNNFLTIYNILNYSRYCGKKLSIRTLEWFVITYAKKKQVGYSLNGSSSSDFFQVHKSYQDQLQSLTKKAFDPFCRGGATRDYNKTVEVQGKKTDLKLTINMGQVNFFNWAISHEVLDYIIKHYEKIIDSKKCAEKKKRQSKHSKSHLDTESSDSDLDVADGRGASSSSSAITGKSSSSMLKGGKTRNRRKKNQGEVVVRHFSQGVTCHMP
jgi:hypothetical protein